MAESRRCVHTQMIKNSDFEEVYIEYYWNLLRLLLDNILNNNFKRTTTYNGLYYSMQTKCKAKCINYDPFFGGGVKRPDT